MDGFIINFDKFLRAASGITVADRASPAEKMPEDALSNEEKRRSIGLMRINHVGEVCAQALYSAQAQFARNPQIARRLAAAAQEEEDHLAWTAGRLEDIGGRVSLLNPLWYAGAYALGMVAAKSGDARSLGFVVETERQVEAHLNGHLELLPSADQKSRAVVRQMCADEAEHGATAKKMGAAELPAPAKLAMRVMAKVMTGTAYYI